MEFRGLGKTGLEVSALGFGGAPVGYLETDRRQVADILNMLLDRGVNLIDTAASYRGSEAAIGEAVGHRRDDYVLVSKCGQAFDDIDGAAWSARAIEQTVARALRRLATDRIDVMLLHSCDLETLQRGEALGALGAARDAGKIRFLGYSGDNEAAAYAAGLEEVAVIETSVSICDQANIDHVLPLARANNVGILAKRPIANAAWKGAAEQRGIYVDYAQTYADRLAKMAITPADLGLPGEEPGSARRSSARRRRRTSKPTWRRCRRGRCRRMPSLSSGRRFAAPSQPPSRPGRDRREVGRRRFGRRRRARATLAHRASRPRRRRDIAIAPQINHSID
jgi:aryl-alcohol dehydrogenase-like predicted oxidoreductase